MFRSELSTTFRFYCWWNRCTWWSSSLSMFSANSSSAYVWMCHYFEWMDTDCKPLHWIVKKTTSLFLWQEWINLKAISFFEFDRSPQLIEILVGTNNLKQGGQRYKVQKLIQHERYNQPSFANDIGLIRINGQIQFNEKVQPIKYSNKFVKGGTHLSTTGWGRIEVFYFAEKIQKIFMEF